MMATTHGFIGSLLALPLYFVSPELFLPVLAAAFIGGIFPDLDLYHGHRKALHYPVYYNVAGVILLPLTLYFTNVYTVSVLFFLLSAGIHCYSDRFGGSKDSRPWLNDSGKAVYSHYHQSWWSPRKIIPYDGSKQDFALMFLASIPTIYLVEGSLRTVLILLVVVSLLYTVFRKKGMEIIPDRFLRKVDTV